MGMITCTSQGYYSKVKTGNVWTAQGISERLVAEAVVAKVGRSLDSDFLSLRESLPNQGVLVQKLEFPPSPLATGGRE